MYVILLLGRTVWYAVSTYMHKYPVSRNFIKINVSGSPAHERGHQFVASAATRIRSAGKAETRAFGYSVYIVEDSKDERNVEFIK